MVFLKVSNVSIEVCFPWQAYLPRSLIYYMPFLADKTSAFYVIIILDIAHCFLLFFELFDNLWLLLSAGKPSLFQEKDSRYVLRQVDRERVDVFSNYFFACNLCDFFVPVRKADLFGACSPGMNHQP